MLSTKAGKTHLSSRTPRSGVCGQCPPYRGHEYLVDHTIVLITVLLCNTKPVQPCTVATAEPLPARCHTIYSKPTKILEENICWEEFTS